MDVRAPALIHTLGYGLAVNAVSWGRGRGRTFALRRWVGSTWTCGRGRVQVSGLRVTLYHFYSHSSKNENLIEYTVSSQHRTSGVSCSLAQGHRPMYNRPPNGP